MTEAQDQALSSMFADYSKKICDAIHGCRSRLSLPIQITSHSFQNPESPFQNVQETDGIVDYHEKFLSICSRGTFSEAYLVDVYLAGLQLEMQTKVRMLKPQTIRQCLLFGKLYEYAYPRHPRKLNGNCTDLVSRSMEDAANHKKGMSDASPAYQVFDEMIGPIDDSEISLNSPELLPEEVHNQPEVQTEGYDASICSSKISISAPPYPSSSLSSTTNVLCEDPIDLESIIPDSLSIDEAHSAISTDNKGLLCAGEAFTVVSPLDGVSPFLKVIPCFLIASEDTSPYCVNLVAFATEGMESFNDLVESDDQMSGYGHSALFGDPLRFVFDPGKQMTNWICAHKSTVSFIHGAWLSILGVSIWPVDSSSFVWDPGVADSYFCPGLSVHILEFYGTGCSCVACWIFIGEG